MASPEDTTADSARGEGETRRDFLTLATAAFGAVGVGVAIWPLIDSMNPAADILAASTTEVDLEPIAVGQRITIVWRGKPVFIDHRSPQRIAEAGKVAMADLKDPEADKDRVQKPEWLIMVGVCTHLGCIPLGQRGKRPTRRIWWLVLPLSRVAL